MRHSRVLNDAEKKQMLIIKDMGTFMMSDQLGNSRELSLVRPRSRKRLSWAFQA